MRFSRMLALAILVSVAIATLAYGGTLVDQGAPGRQGPWPVYCVTQSNYLISKANAGFSLTPGSIAGHAVYTSTQTLTGAVAGGACAVVVPGGFDSTDLVATCIPGAGNVTFYIYNTTAGSLTGTSGTYTAVVF